METYRRGEDPRRTAQAVAGCLQRVANVSLTAVQPDLSAQTPAAQPRPREPRRQSVAARVVRRGTAGVACNTRGEQNGRRDGRGLHDRATVVARRNSESCGAVCGASLESSTGRLPD